MHNACQKILHSLVSLIYLEEQNHIVCTDDINSIQAFKQELIRSTNLS